MFGFFITTVLSRLNLKNCHVEWNEIGDVWLYWDDVKSRIIRNVGERIGFSSGKETKKITKNEVQSYLRGSGHTCCDAIKSTKDPAGLPYVHVACLFHLI